jgi:hypothetical protein
MRTGRRLFGTVIVIAVVIGIGGAAGLIANLVGRDNAFTIDQFDVDLRVTPEGTVEVLETIDVTFHVERRGIFREIPLSGPLGRGQTTIAVYGVDQGSDDEPWNWATESMEDGRRLRRILLAASPEGITDELLATAVMAGLGTRSKPPSGPVGALWDRLHQALKRDPELARSFGVGARELKKAASEDADESETEEASVKD